MNFLGSSFYINKPNFNKVVEKSISSPILNNYSSNSLDTISENDSYVADKKTNFLEKIKNTFNRLFSSCSLKKDKTVSSPIENPQQQNNEAPQHLYSQLQFNNFVPGIYFVDDTHFDEKSYSPMNYQFSEHSSASYLNFDLLTNTSSMTTTPMSEFYPSSYDFVREAYKARHGK